MNKRKFPVFLLFLALVMFAAGFGVSRWGILSEPVEVRLLRKQQVVQTDEGHQEYYFGLLSEEEQRGYREILEGIRNLEEKFYLSLSGDDEIDRVYHAVLKDHPELFWVHNREKVYKTTYAGKDYCQFSPGYTYTETERQEISQAMENAYQEVLAQIPEGADDYEKVMTVYTYIIDNTDYVLSDDDQSIAGTFWKKQAVCAGYAGAVQYLLERLNVTCIYVEGDAALLEEHKTTIYDYLCPFPKEYEMNYTASDEFEVPSCTATDMNFYVRNGACFNDYVWNDVYDLCKLRIDSDAAVVRFKFSTQEAFEEAYMELIDSNRIQDIARYYMEVHGLSQISYHYGILDNMKTLYFMF